MMDKPKQEKDRYGGFSVGMAVEKPKEDDKYRFNNGIAKVYKKSIAEAVANAVYDQFDFEEVQIDGKQCIQIRLSILPYEKYEQLKRKAVKSDRISRKA